MGGGGELTLKCPSHLPTLVIMKPAFKSFFTQYDPLLNFRTITTTLLELDIFGLHRIGREASKKS